ncbi:hypothetical protein M758_12G007700 [Ceratodon purpureus]|nr:hypothetical protein M758_12G007700 [Ceratodon purpureus]
MVDFQRCFITNGASNFQAEEDHTRHMRADYFMIVSLLVTCTHNPTSALMSSMLKSIGNLVQCVPFCKMIFILRLKKKTKKRKVHFFMWKHQIQSLLKLIG